MHSCKKLHSLVIYIIKLQFLLNYKNMFKNIAIASSECTANLKKKASYSTDYIVPDLIDFFGND